MITVGDAIIRCADLVRGCDPEREITRVTVTRDGDLVTIAACDGHNALRYDFVLRNGEADAWQPETWTAPGASFPRWGSSPWRVWPAGGVIVCEPRTATGEKSRRKTRLVALDSGHSIVLGHWGILAAALPERRDLSIDGWSETLALLANAAPIEIYGDASGASIRAGALRADMGDGPYISGWARVPAGKLAAAIEALGGAEELRLFLGCSEREPVVVRGRNPELDGDVYAAVAQLK